MNASFLISQKSLQYFALEIDRRIYRVEHDTIFSDVIYSTNELELICKDGSVKIVELSSTLILDEKGTPVLLSGIARDITLRHLYEVKLRNRIKAANTFITKKEHPNDVPSKIHIFFFHKFRVIGKNSTPIQWKTLKNEELFAYFLSAKNQTLSRDDIIEQLWPDIESQKARKYLHNTLYSMKKDLINADISFKTNYKNNLYSYEIEPYSSDLESFDYIIRKIVHPFHYIDEESIENIELLIDLYQGDYLEQNAYLWSIPKSIDYQKKFKSVALRVAKHYFINRNYSDTRRILNKILCVNYEDESVHELLLKVYLKSKDYHAFLEHFDAMFQNFYHVYSMKPKKTVQKLYDTYYIPAKKHIENTSASFH